MHASETEQLANETRDEDVIFVPSFSGLGAPYWNMNVKGTIFGLSRNSGSKEICKAALESLALQTRDVLIAMEKDANLKLTTLAVDGGACENNFLMQFQADVLNCNVSRPSMIESTALGAALLAGYKNDFFTQNNEDNRDIFRPNPSHKINQKIKNWNKAIQTLLTHYDI